MTAGNQDRMEPMTSENENTIIQTRLLYLNAVVQGVSTGLFVGVGLFIVTIWLVLKGGETVGPHLALLGQYFIGYSVTWGGSFHIAQRATQAAEKPADDSGAFRLAVKKGRDGRDGLKGEKGERGAEGRSGQDLGFQSPRGPI